MRSAPVTSEPARTGWWGSRAAALGRAARAPSRCWSSGSRSSAVAAVVALTRPSEVGVEAHTLGQRELAGVVDGHRGPAHVRLPRVRTGLPPAARGLLASEGAADLRTARTDVDVGDAAV